MRFVSGTLVSSARDMTHLADCVGLPRKARYVDVMATRLERAFEFFDVHDEKGLMICIRIMRSYDSILIEKFFSRINVARMPLEIVNCLMDRIWATIDYGVQHFKYHDNEGQNGYNDFWVNAVRLNVEIHSRLVIRLPDTEAAKAFRRAALFAKDSRWCHWWLYKPLGHLLERSITSVRPNNRKKMLVDVLNIPLPDERDIYGLEHDWPELIDSLSSSLIIQPSDDATIRERIISLIDKVRSSVAFSRGRAALRLTYLYDANCLGQDESKQFGQALWSRQDAVDKFPSDTQLLPHVFLRLTAPDPELVGRIFRTQILSRLLHEGISEDRLTALIGSAHPPTGQSRIFKLELSDAKSLLDVILDWQPKNVEFDFGENLTSNHAIKRALGPALADVVLPVLSNDSVSAQQDRQVA